MQTCSDLCMCISIHFLDDSWKHCAFSNLVSQPFRTASPSRTSHRGCRASSDSLPFSRKQTAGGLWGLWALWGLAILAWLCGRTAAAYAVNLAAPLPKFAEATQHHESWAKKNYVETLRRISAIPRTHWEIVNDERQCFLWNKTENNAAAVLARATS